MKQIHLHNPFGGPIYHEEIVSSTMDISRVLAANGEPSGTVIIADFQEKGRGRQNRQWKTEKGQSLIFTIFFNYADFSSVPKALTLRAGLAVALAIEDFFPDLAGIAEIKWPNDVMLKSKKIAGILVETTAVVPTTAESTAFENGSANVFIGIGVNLLQRDFPEDLRGKAGSLLSVFTEEFLGREMPAIFAANDVPLLLLERILVFLHSEITASESSWKTALEKRLYKRGEAVVFADGAADSQKLVKGRFFGIEETGELLLIPDGEAEPRPFINGELRIYKYE
jgi:BirA family biotin operon repressor/biotin-[acetyl-CoA-carboxylase] ligase